MNTFVLFEQTQVGIAASSIEAVSRGGSCGGGGAGAEQAFPRQLPLHGGPRLVELISVIFEDLLVTLEGVLHDGGVSWCRGAVLRHLTVYIA